MASTQHIDNEFSARFFADFFQLYPQSSRQYRCSDITYVSMPGGHAYLCAVMDWYSRKVLGWAVSNTMETGRGLEALENALAATGRVPEIFNTDQGCQFKM